MQKEQAYRYIALLSPIVSVLCAGGLAFFEFRRLQEFQGEVSATQKKIAIINQSLKDYQMAPTSKQVPTAERGPHEQSMFLDNLRMLAINSHIQITRISNAEAPPPAPPPLPPTEGSPPAPPSKYPPGVGPVTSQIEVSGNQFNVRKFMYGVQRSPRLLTMTDMKWVRDTWPNTHLLFTLTRYVGPSPTLGTAAPATPAATNVSLNGSGPFNVSTDSLIDSDADKKAANESSSETVHVTTQTHKLAPGKSHGINGTTTGLQEGVNKIFKSSDKQTHQGPVLSPTTGNSGSGSNR